MSLTQKDIELTDSPAGWQYQEQLFNRKRLAILGGGHCALALSRVMSNLNYEVCVFETRSDLATLTQNTVDHSLAYSVQTVEDYQTVGAALLYPEITCVAVMTTDVDSDIRALLGIVPYPFPYIGVMGSPAKLAHIWDQLKQKGVDSEVLARLFAPIGLPLQTHTPEEIAISVAAQILQERSQWQPWEHKAHHVQSSS